METRTTRSVLSILSLAVLSSTGCVESEYFDVTAFDDELEMAIEDLQDGGLTFEDSSMTLLASEGSDGFERETPVGPLADLTARQIHQQVFTMMENDRCDANGIVSGRFMTEDGDLGIGEFQGVLKRSAEDIILDFAGDWSVSIADEDMGMLNGVFENHEGNEGVMEGMYYPRLESTAGPLGTFQMSLDMPTLDDSASDGTVHVLKGVWHDLMTGDGILVGYRAKCRLPGVADPVE